MSSHDREAPDIFLEARRLGTLADEPLLGERMSRTELIASSRILAENFMGEMVLEKPVYNSGRAGDYMMRGSAIECGFTVSSIPDGVRFGDEEITEHEAVDFARRNYLSLDRAPLTFLGEMVSAMGDNPEIIAETTAEVIDMFGGYFQDYYATLENDREGIMVYPNVDDFGVLRVFAGEDYGAGRIDRQDFETIMRLTEINPREAQSELVLEQMREAGRVLLGFRAEAFTSEESKAAAD